jgi:hypothetical protein
MWFISKLQRENFVINYKWHSITVLDMCTEFLDVIIFLILLTLYIACRKFYSYRICCQMNNSISSREPCCLHDSIQFGRSRRLGRIIIPRHNYAATAASFFVLRAILWNDLPLSVREKGAIGKFREKCHLFMEQTANNLYFWSFWSHLWWVSIRYCVYILLNF